MPSEGLRQQQSWLESANEHALGFPLSFLPFCAFAADDRVRLGVGIGDHVLDLRAAAENGLLAKANAALRAACVAPSLNELMNCGPKSWSLLRADLTELLAECASARTQRELRRLLYSSHELQFVMPVQVTDYTDFYASREHAMNVGKLFRPHQPLLPNYEWVPIGYHGRASSVVISGTAVRRPSGQQMLEGAALPLFEPSRQLDYELELAAYVGTATELGVGVSIADADEHIFGYSLLNDWSVRDIQSWEYQPLGPFLGKSFATSVSPWVVPSAALAPYRVPARRRTAAEPQPLRYLREQPDARHALDVRVEALLTTERMRRTGEQPFHVSSSNAKDLFWTFPQMLAHQTSNGCNLRAGNLLASGTISGGATGTEGSLLERTQRGANPLKLPNGETRSFLEDGDEVILRAFCQREGLPSISLGECRGVILPAL